MISCLDGTDFSDKGGIPIVLESLWYFIALETISKDWHWDRKCKVEESR